MTDTGEMLFRCIDIKPNELDLGWIMRMGFSTEDEDLPKCLAVTFPGKFSLCRTAHDVANRFREIADTIDAEVK